MWYRDKRLMGMRVKGLRVSSDSLGPSSGTRGDSSRRFGL